MDAEGGGGGGVIGVGGGVAAQKTSEGHSIHLRGNTAQRVVRIFTTGAFDGALSPVNEKEVMDALDLSVLQGGAVGGGNGGTAIDGGRSTRSGGAIAGNESRNRRQS